MGAKWSIPAQNDTVVAGCVPWFVVCTCYERNWCSAHVVVTTMFWVLRTIMSYVVCFHDAPVEHCVVILQAKYSIPTPVVDDATILILKSLCCTARHFVYIGKFARWYTGTTWRRAFVDYRVVSHFVRHSRGFHKKAAGDVWTRCHIACL